MFGNWLSKDWIQSLDPKIESKDRIQRSDSKIWSIDWIQRSDVQADVETIAAPLFSRGKQKQPVVGFAGEHCHPSFYRLAPWIGIWMLFFLGVWFECLIVWVDSLKVWLNRLHNLVVRRKSKTKCLSCHLPFREFRLFIVFLWFSNSGLDFINILILSAPAMALISLVAQLLNLW